MTTYTAYALNVEGAVTRVGIDSGNPNGGRKFTAINDAAQAARDELGPGWRVYIINEDGRSVKVFTRR